MGHRKLCAVLAGLLLPVSLLAITGCKQSSADVVDADVAALFGGEDALKLISSAETATAFRISAMQVAESEGSEPSHEQESIGDYPVTAGPVPIDPASRQQLTEILRNPRTYDFEIAKGCEFMPGVALRFADSSTTLDILLCFSCSELQILRNGKRVGHEDFDDARRQLLAVAKRLFPDDDALQSEQ